MILGVVGSVYVCVSWGVYPLQMHECVCLCAVPRPSDPHECLSEVHVLIVVSSV